MNKLIKALLLSALVLPATLIQAQPIGENIMEGVELIRSKSPCDPDLAIIHMHYPVRYISHYPQDPSDELRIRIKHIQVAPIDQDARDLRESATPEDHNLLDEVVYEGDFSGGPYLTLQYLEAVRSEVIQGSDYRTIKVLIYPSKRIQQAKCQ
ncbi:hypothetical protein [Amphritea pacifica]|uniref:DUF4426 domain-containing protein n=1 Tax=Amphritea pacifica TaxID=2811233 RepID=A0ABS2W772_9GAMM|nr:hypothetical protein [Amphritea pacifica]MBN0987544.1 hypothetical protein [Amphritea pacifica]MBN1005133.1 hypothetical protein [Amphritea pacifica]